MRGRKIGLLGGSFNPAHEGHRYISAMALRTLDLDQVWWLVSPQNPLKSAEGMADYQSRIAAAKAVARNPNIVVSDIEQQLGQTYTANSLQQLHAYYPDHHFVWLMGADNLVQIPNWYRWHDIFHTCPIAVFDRPGYTFAALVGKAAAQYAKDRVFPSAPGRPVKNFALLEAPAWTFIPTTKHKLSSTYMRKRTKKTVKACS